MTTPCSRSNSSSALSTGPPRTILQQLLDDINGALSARTVHNVSPPRSPASARLGFSSLNHSPSVWVDGSSNAQGARDKLRAADEARQRKVATSTIDGAPDSQTPRLHLDTTFDDYEQRQLSGIDPTPDPIRYPHDHMQHMLKGSRLSTTDGLSPAAQGHGSAVFPLQTSPFGSIIPPPLSPLMFSDVDFNDSSFSPRTETTASPTEIPTSATTIYTAEEPHTPTDNGRRKRTHFLVNSTSETSPQKRRTVTLPDIRNEEYFEVAVEAPHRFTSLGVDNRCLLRDEAFIERVPVPKMSCDMLTNDALPQLSSFRPTQADLKGQLELGFPSQKPARKFTSPANPVSPTVPDTPAWMRPMHLVDTNGKSIYRNVHDNGPVRHALCLWCFRTHGDFRKVYKHGYESCGRTRVLESHYWESDMWPEDFSDESTSSDG